MPTVLRIGPYTFVFFSSDHSEPEHIHVKRDGDIAKFWLNPVECAYNKHFTKHEINAIEKIVHEYRSYFEEKWHEFFGA